MAAIAGNWFDDQAAKKVLRQFLDGWVNGDPEKDIVFEGVKVHVDAAKTFQSPTGLVKYEVISSDTMRENSSYKLIVNLHMETAAESLTQVKRTYLVSKKTAGVAPLIISELL